MQFLPKKFSFGFGFGGEESFKSKKAGELEFFGAFMEEISFMSIFASLACVVGHFYGRIFLSCPISQA